MFSQVNGGVENSIKGDKVTFKTAGNIKKNDFVTLNEELQTIKIYENAYQSNSVQLDDDRVLIVNKYTSNVYYVLKAVDGDLVKGTSVTVPNGVTNNASYSEINAKLIDETHVIVCWGSPLSVQILTINDTEITCGNIHVVDSRDTNSYSGCSNDIILIDKNTALIAYNTSVQTSVSIATVKISNNVIVSSSYILANSTTYMAMKCKFFKAGERIYLVHGTTLYDTTIYISEITFSNNIVTYGTAVVSGFMSQGQTYSHYTFEVFYDEILDKYICFYSGGTSGRYCYYGFISVGSDGSLAFDGNKAMFSSNNDMKFGVFKDGNDYYMYDCTTADGKIMVKYKLSVLTDGTVSITSENISLNKAGLNSGCRMAIKMSIGEITFLSDGTCRNPYCIPLISVASKSEKNSACHGIAAKDSTSNIVQVIRPA